MIRPFIPADLPAICAIQAHCPQAAQWRESDYQRLADDDGGTILVAEISGATTPQIAGFCAYLRLGEEAELRNLAIHPTQQRKGIARALLVEGAGRMRKLGVRQIFLEGRASNQPALALYHSLGFRLLYKRRNYYHHPEEDALVMACDVTRSSEPIELHRELT